MPAKNIFDKVKKCIKIGSIVLFVFALFNIVNATDKNLVISKLASNGFENIRVKLEDSRILIAYENRVYRFEV